MWRASRSAQQRWSRARGTQVDSCPCVNEAQAQTCLAPRPLHPGSGRSTPCRAPALCQRRRPWQGRGSEARRGPHSQTHRRAAMGGFVTTRRRQAVAGPLAQPPLLLASFLQLLLQLLKPSRSYNLKLGLRADHVRRHGQPCSVLLSCVLSNAHIAGSCSQERAPRVSAICRSELA